MDNDIRKMMAGRIETIKLAVDHVRNPGERMPVAGMDMDEGPADAARRKAATDLRILEDVIAVIKVDEFVAQRLAKNEPGNRAEKNNDGERKPAIGCGAPRFCSLRFHSQPELWTGK